jgi:hypothetical protein
MSNDVVMTAWRAAELASSTRKAMAERMAAELDDPSSRRVEARIQTNLVLEEIRRAIVSNGSTTVHIRIGELTSDWDPNLVHKQSTKVWNNLLALGYKIKGSCSTDWSNEVWTISFRAE